MRQTWRMMLARFPYGGSDRTELVPWAASAALWAAGQPDIEGTLRMWHVDDTPVTMCRNLAVRTAIESEVDILVMVDNDMAPDIDREHPFLPAAFDFIKSRWHKAPTIISAPYLTSGPSYNPVMGTWRTFSEGNVIKTKLYTREEAIDMQGIQPCPLQGTGMMAIDMRIFTGFPVGDEVAKLSPPWFYYEYTDEYQTAKASTEDMVFTRNATLLFAKYGLEIGYVDWDSWSYHVKTEFVGKPFKVSIMDIPTVYRGDYMTYPSQETKGVEP